MEITSIRATTIPDAWFQALYQLIDCLKNKRGARRYNVQTGSDAGQDRLEFDFAILHITQPSARPLTPHIPEHLGIPPVSDEKYEQEYLSYLLSPVRQPNEHYTYGERFTIGFEHAIKYYKKYGFDTNRICFEIARPEDLLLYDLKTGDGSSPCLRLIDTRVINNKLNFVCYFRSWNLWNGMPNNLSAIQQAKELMASEIGVEDGELIAISKGLNIRAYNLEVAFMRLQKELDLNVGK
jgi:thymidylate synthase